MTLLIGLLVLVCSALHGAGINANVYWGGPHNSPPHIEIDHVSP